MKKKWTHNPNIPQEMFLWSGNGATALLGPRSSSVDNSMDVTAANTQFHWAQTFANSGQWPRHERSSAPLLRQHAGLAAKAKREITLTVLLLL